MARSSSLAVPPKSLSEDSRGAERDVRAGEVEHREEVAFFSQRIRRRRKRLSHECVRSTTQRRARYRGTARRSRASSPRLLMGSV